MCDTRSKDKGHSHRCQVAATLQKTWNCFLGSPVQGLTFACRLVQQVVLDLLCKQTKNILPISIYIYVYAHPYVIRAFQNFIFLSIPPI